MRRAILTKADRIVSEYVYHLPFHERGEAYRRTHVVGEYQEGRTVGNAPAVQRDAVQDAAHSVLADPEMEVRANSRRRGEERRGLDGCQVRAGEVARATHELRQFRGDRVQHNTRGGPARHIAVGRVEHGHGVVPTGGEIAVDAPS